MYFCITSLCKFVDSNFLLCNTWTWCRKYWKWSLLLFVELSYRRQSTFANLMLDEYQLQNMDHTRCRSRSCNWVPFSVLCGYISYNHSDDVLPAHLALILDVPGRWAILENTHSYHCSPGVCGYCHGHQQKFCEGCESYSQQWNLIAHSSVPIQENFKILPETSLCLFNMGRVNSSGCTTALSSSTAIMNHNIG